MLSKCPCHLSLNFSLRPQCPPSSQFFTCLVFSWGDTEHIHPVIPISVLSIFESLSHLPSWSMSCIIGQATSDACSVHLTLHLRRWCSECQEWCQLRAHFTPNLPLPTCQSDSRNYPLYHISLHRYLCLLFVRRLAGLTHSKILHTTLHG